jgi:hypothetical protein
MIDSGASGVGFVDTAFAARCGVTLQPSQRRITLADGSEVRAAGEATITYTLESRPCHVKDRAVPVQFTSTFVATPLAPYELILGVGWLEQHHALIGFSERSIQLRVDGKGKQYCIRPLGRCNEDGTAASEAAPLQLKAIAQKKVCKLLRQRAVEELYAVLIRPADTEPGDKPPGEKPPLGSEHPRVRALLDEFKGSVFGDPKPGVPRKRGVEHAIQLLPGTQPPPARPLRHQSEKDAAVMREYVEAGLMSGILRPSTSPYGSMALIVKKKDGTPRVVIDYRALNDVTVKNKYPLPLMDELFDRTQGARFFTSIDLRNGFHQIAIQPGDREKTAFRTRFGHFEYTVLPMGLCNAPGTFMQLMNQTFADMLDSCVLCFLDDILIFSRTEEEHLRHLRTVLTRLRDQELYVKPSKCAFMQREVAFLGHRIGADGLRVAPDKIGAVQQWPQPRSVTDVRSFLGLANFYRRFVKDYSRIALPLTELTKETTAWRWGTQEQAAFDALKAALCSPPVLLVPDQSKPFVLNTDACKYAIGATLQQDHGNGLQPVAFFSAKMSDAERNYDVREQEFMALVRACLHWRHYLHGTQPFTLLTDHDSLKYHRTMPQLEGRLARWVEKMAEFDYTLKHIPGKDNIVADALSRRVDHAGSASSQPPPQPRTPPLPTANRFDALATLELLESAAASMRSHLCATRIANKPEPTAVRRAHLDAARKVLPPAPDAPRPNRSGTIVTPAQRCTAVNSRIGGQCAQRTAVGHLCWNHLRRDAGLRVRKSTVPGAGRGLFAARDLPAEHDIPYTGDTIDLTDLRSGGPYVLQTRVGEGIDAARRNCGMGRWVNDPNGAVDERGQPRQANCKFVIWTPRGGADKPRVAAVRTLRAVSSGEELFVKYGDAYWQYYAGGALKKKVAARKRLRKNAPQLPRVQAEQEPEPQAQAQAPAPGDGAAPAAPRPMARKQAERGSRRRDRRFEEVLVLTLAAADGEAARAAPQRRSARVARQQMAPTQAGARPERGVSARAGRSAVTAPAAEAAAGTHPDAPHDDDGAQPMERARGEQRPGASSPPLMDAARQAAAADEEYQRWLQTPPQGCSAQRGLLFDERHRLRVPNDAALRTRLLAELHDSATGAHAGRDRMLAAAQARFDWRGLAGDVEQYVLTCDACQRNKHSKQLKPGLLMPLPLPEEPCLHWTTDAVTGLQRSRGGFDAIQVYVDRLTKLKRFVATRTTDGSVQLADATLRAVIGPHGMPKSLVSDRDPRITARFWRELSRRLGSEVNLSTARHPQSDGQSEREIQTLVTALRSYVNAMGDDWDAFLPALELGFNSKVQASTGAAPFTLVYGTQARLPIDCTLDDARPATVPAAEERAVRMGKALELARSHAEQAQARQKRLADRHRRLLQLRDGDEVLLSTEGLQLRSGSHKLTARYVGPFRVIGAVNDNAVTLELPPLLGALHPTFNIARLKLYRDGNERFPGRPARRAQPPAVDADTNGAPRYEVESALAQRGTGAQRELLVRWLGYSAEHDEWVRRSELARSAPDTVAQFDARQQGRAALSALAEARAVLNALTPRAAPQRDLTRYGIEPNPGPPKKGTKRKTPPAAVKQYGIKSAANAGTFKPPPRVPPPETCAVRGCADDCGGGACAAAGADEDYGPRCGLPLAPNRYTCMQCDRCRERDESWRRWLAVKAQREINGLRSSAAWRGVQGGGYAAGTVR